MPLNFFIFVRRSAKETSRRTFEERVIVEDKQRHRRLRLLIKQLNKKRKKQAKKIDILCNDFIGAQREFIKSLKTISFVANFYESIIGVTELNKLLYTAVKLIKEENTDANVTFFLRQSGNFELYMFESEQPITFEKQHLEDSFTAELMDAICKSNKVCTLDDMFAMGLQGNLVGLNKISGATIPLCLQGTSLGFILVCRSSDNKLTAEEINNISAVTCGLSRAIHSCQTIFHSAD
jgi:transcriptional regulator with GAF, ATPase, and Fis domain